MGAGSEVTILAAGKPAAPENLANDPAVTNSGIIGITWSAPSSNGGSSIIDYQISYRTASTAYSVVTGITTRSYTASSLTADAIYIFKVQARNVAGLSADSAEVAIRAAKEPNAPGAPTTAVNSNYSVTISWIAPSNNGGS